MYWVQDNTRYPFNTSGLENSFLGLKVSRQNSSNDCVLLIGCVAITFLLASNDLGFAQPRKILAGETEQPPINFLIVVAGRAAQPFQPSRSLVLLVRSGAVENLAVVRGLILGHMFAILEVRIFRHLGDVEHAARRYLLLGELALGFGARIVFEPLPEHGVGFHLLVVGQTVGDFAQVGIAQDVFFNRGAFITDGAPDAVPEAGMTTAHHHVAVLARVHGIDIDGQVPVAIPRTNAAVHRVPRPAVIEDADDGFRGRRLDELAFAGNVFGIHYGRENDPGRR